MLRGEALRLVRPARIAFGADRMQADDLAITYGKAQATVSAVKTPQKVEGRLALRDVDLAIIEVSTWRRNQRHGECRCRSYGNAGGPLLTAEARATGVSLAGVRQRVQARTPKLSVALTARVGNGRAEANLTGQGLGEVPLRANVSAPVRFAIEPFTFAVAEAGPIQGTVVWRGDIDPLFQMLPIDAFLLSGYANVDLAIGGTVQSPAVNGEIGLARGSLEAFATGTVLRPLDLTITAAQNEWRLTRLEARDGGNGTLAASGMVALADPPRVDGRIELQLRRAATRRHRLHTEWRAFTADGAIGERLLVSGRIENEQTEIRLVNRLPPSIVTVDVVFKDELPSKEPAAAPGPGTGRVLIALI